MSAAMGAAGTFLNVLALILLASSNLRTFNALPQ